MAILSKAQFKYSIALDIAVLLILFVMQSHLHEASHALGVIIVGGEVDTIVIKAFDPEQSYVAYQIVYSDYSELYHAIVKLLPHVLLGIIGIYLVHKGINRIKLAGKDAVDKYAYLLGASHTCPASCAALGNLGKHRGERGVPPRIPPGSSRFPRISDAPYLLIGLLYLGIGIWWFLPLRYLNLSPYFQFDIPQAALHLSNFAHLHFPEQTLFLSSLPAEFQIPLLIFGLIGLSGMIYVGLWLSLGQVGPNPPVLQRGAAVGFEKDRREGGRVFQLPGK
jgi:hypothetical protein